MGCVNTSSREFKSLAVKNNVSPSKLELIVHKYWLQTGREDSFPSDIYIQAQLGNSQYLEPIESVRKLWQLKYSSPLEFPSLEQMLSTYGEAAKCFPKSAIFYYKNTDSKYVLSIQQPVAKLSSKAEFFSNHDSMKSPSPLDLGLQEGRTYTVDRLQEFYSQFNTDPTSKALASKVFSIAKDLGLNVYFTDSIPDYSNGRYINNNSVFIRKSYLENGAENASKAKTILHELLHAVSSYALDSDNVSKELSQFKTEMTSLWQELKSHPFLSGEYGNTDVFEFVAELSNPVFRGQIQRVDRLNASKNNGIKSFWNRILNAFRSLLGLHTTDSYYQRSMNALDQALGAFDIDAYMRYNGIKDSFRKNDINSSSDAQLNSSLGVIDNAARSGKWTPAALETLYNLTDDIKNGKIRYQRFPSGTSKEGYKGSRANAAASLLLRANEGAGTENTRSFSESQRRREEERPVQERLIESWAKAAGLWYSNLDTVKGKKLFAEGGEAKVFANDNDKNVVKALSTRYFITPQLALDRITLHNLLFPEAPLSVTGFGRNSKGEFIILAEQPFVQGEKASQSDIGQFITRAGFSKYERDNAHTFTSDDIYLSYLHDENVIKTPQGNLVVIDADLRLNTPDLGVGGKYVIDDRVVSVHDALAEDFVRSMSDAQRQEEADLIRQESADYDIINSNSMSKPKRKKAKAVPQSFTFADGTVVKAPFHPNAQQVAALNALDAFMKSNETSITLSGFAGTGKTSLMEMIARKAQKMYKNVVFSATTNKAAAVLGERVAKAGFKASTLNKVFGINVEVDSKASSYNARNLVNVLKDANVDYGSVVIIDEASMINEENYNILNDIARSKGLKIIYVGDEAQLAPVGEILISKVFRNTEGKVIRLTQVERTGDNAILREATDLRNGKPLSGISSFNAEGEGVAYLSPKNTKAIGEVINAYVGGLKQDPNYFRILAFTNKAVSDYNQQVRHLLGYTSIVPQVGEPMTGYANWGYNYHNKSYRFINSESYRVVRVDRPKLVSIKLQNGYRVSMESNPLTLQDSTGHTDTFSFMDIKGNPQNKQAAILLANEKQRLWGMARKTYGKEAKAKILQKINEIDSFLFVNDNIIDNHGNYLQTKTIDFGYALTVHKSQGSTFTNVLLDDVDIAKASRGNSMMPVGFEEDNSQDGSQAEQLNAEAVDLGDFSDVPDALVDDKVADIRQQLEYVGVSRATDTVTIISNNVKREGSPLHPNDADKKDSDTEDTINPPTSRSSNEVAAQLVSHLKGMGINVLGREAMQEYLSSHNLQYLQQMVNNYYMTVDNPSEVEVLRHALFDKFKNKSSFGCIGRTANFWYLCDYFGDSTYRVRAQISIEGNEGLLNDFEKAIRNESFRSTEDFSRRFEAFKSSRGEHYHGGTDAKVTVSTNGNARMAGQQLQAEENTLKRGGDGQSSVYNAESQTEFLITSQGEVYGFVDKDGNVYLDETKISPEHPIHEYTHLWDRAVAKHNPELWNRGVELMKQTSLWNDVLNDDNYGKKWQALKGITPQKLDSLVASEVHSCFVGKGGAKLLDSLAKEKGQSAVVSKLKQWILDVWRDLKATFTGWSKDDLDKLTLKDFNHMTVRDFTEGINPMKVSTARTSEATVVSKQKASEESLTDNSNTFKDEDSVSSPSTKQLITVSLPGYEYFNDLYKDSTVDAEWKIPYLKELDAQLTIDKPEQTIQNTINQMNMVFQATSEEEYLQDIGEAGKSEVDKALSEYDRLNRQIDNLLDFTGYNDIEEGFAALPASEVRHAAEQIANEISDEITRLQTEEGRASKIFPNLNTKLDFSTASRREIVEAVGVDRLILKVKDLFDSEAHHFDDIVDSCQADLIFDNWDAMIVLGADVFALNEGFGITKNFNDKGRFFTTDDSKVDYDNFNDYSNDMDVAAEEGEKDEQEHWQVESKTIDVLNSMSALVRQGLHQCYVLDDKGNKVLSKWRIAERVNPRKAVNNILRWTQGSLSLDDMVSRLKSKQPQNPWLSQLIGKLSDKSGRESDFQSQFYSVFQKHFQLYSVVQLEDGKYHSVTVNSHPALSEAMATVTSQYKIGELPLFRENRVNAKVLGSKDSSSSDFTLHKALSELRSIDKALKGGKVLDSDTSQSAAANVMGVCRIFGYNVSEDSVSGVVNAENIQKFTEYLGYIVRSLDSVLAAQRRGELYDYEPFGFGKAHNIDGSLKNFLSPITDVLEDSAVSAFYDSGKMYQSYVTPSFMSKLVNKFKLEGQEFEDFIMQEYGSSEWFKFQDNGNPFNMGWRNGWLRRLATDENARKVFSHKVELNFNKHNYMRNMTDAEYTLSLLAEYFSEANYKAGDMSPAWFRIPMQSNKPSSEFIRFYSFRDTDYKSHIVSSLHDMFLQELSRIQTVLMRNFSKSDSQFIKNFDSNGRRFCFLPVFNAYMDNSKQSLAKRRLLHSVVEYDAQRLDELQQKEDFYKQKATELSKWEDAYVSRMLDEDLMYDKNDDPVIRQQYSKLREFSLSDAEVQELKKLKDLKEESSRVLDDTSDSRFASLLQKKIRGEKALSAEEEVELGSLADRILRQSMEQKVQSVLNAWENSGILSAAKSVQGLCPSKGKDGEIMEQVRKSVENFLWNDAYASKNILQLTLSDIAFYKDTEDLQKRLAQLHAPGMRGNVSAVDYSGKRVSDGRYRTFILQDFDSFKSNIIANISEVFDRRISAAPDSQKALMVALKESLVGKDGKYTKINVTDAQGYSSPSSYRKKAFIFGRWSRHAEDIYQKLLGGDYTYTDLAVAFQPLKPFVYSKLTKDLGVPNAPIHSMQVPFQAKNAEYLLIMADAILKGEQLSRPNLLRAVYRVMEDSERLNPTKGIDTVQFESAIKSGLQGKMNIFQFRDMEGGEEAAYTYMMNQIYKEEYDASGARVYRNYNTDTFVHEAPFEDYCLQQEVPEHFKEHSQAHGSQIRMITPSDLDFFTTDAEGNRVDNFYEFTEPDGTVRKLKADEFRKEYEQTIADNIEQSINDLSAELHLDSMDKRERNIALSKILQREVLSSPRYGIDLIQACAIDKESGEFRIPKGDPIQSKRIEQLINSVIKNRINKQKIAGGPIVQVSNFGTSQQLHIRFNDRQGSLIPLEADYVPSEHNGLSYKEYLKKNQGGIAYFEVFAPIWSNELFSKFSNADGSINVEAIDAVSPELLKMVSYRIPTEDKYSCAPMKVVGFMPREAGDAIMLPYELTEIDDSDFDVDKRYVMRKDIEIKNRNISDFMDELVLRGRELYRQIMGSEASKGSVVISEDAGDYVQKMVDSLLSSPRRFPRNSPFRKALYSEYQKLAYSAEAPLSGRQYRDNKIVDMTYAVLTNPMTADKILNPGGFDAPKRMGYMVAAYKNPANSLTWEKLQGKSVDELKELSYTDKDLTFADTQVQFYKQNSAAASLIGVFAVNKVAHATLESNDVFLDVSEVCGEEPFSIAATTFEGRMPVDAKYDMEGNLIGKTLGSLVSASADAVKDPILNLMNVNMVTAGMLNTMLRLGMTFNDAALFLSQDVIERTISEFNRKNLDGYASLSSVVEERLDAYRQEYDIKDGSVINTEPLTREELVEGLTSSSHEATDYKVLLAFQKLRSLTDAMRNITFSTRFNSISSAVGPLIVDNLIIEHKMQSFTDVDSEGSTHFYTADGTTVDINDVFSEHPVLAQFARTVDIAKSLFSDMPAGSTGFRGLLAALPEGLVNTMFADKKLLDQFSGFYQSYLLLQSGFIKERQLDNYVNRFPKWFIEQGFKEKYPDNALLQAIRMNVSKASKMPYLSVSITGMDEQQKEALKTAWIDLHKTEPELSLMLFNYCFFRTGVGFSPKSFMSLVPTYVKERLKTKENVSYVDTYRKFPEVAGSLVIDQFIRNNWQNNKLVPVKGGKNSHYDIDVEHGVLIVYRSEEVAELAGIPYIKTKSNNSVYLWKLSASNPDTLAFSLVSPLGGNGEYFEMSLSDIKKSLADTNKSSVNESLSNESEVLEDNSPSDLKTTSSQESETATLSKPVISSTESAKKLSELASLFMQQNPKFSAEAAEAKIEEIKNGNVRTYAKFLQNVFKHKGLNLSIDDAMKEFKKYC